MKSSKSSTKSSMKGGRRSRRRRRSVNQHDKNDFVALQSLLVNGDIFTKHGSSHKPHPRKLWCSEDLHYLYWCPPDDTSKIKNVPASAITEVVAGWSKGSGFKRLKKKFEKGKATTKEECCFSLVFSQRTLDFEAYSEDARNRWVHCYSWLKAQKSQRGVGLPFNVRHNAHVDLNFEWSGEDLERDFLLSKKLGEGSFGEVYECVHRSSGFILAAKLVDESSHTIEKIKEIREEAEILKQCRNQNIVNFFGCWGPDKLGNLWIMMQLCDGGSLNDILERGLYEPDKEVYLSEEQISYIAQTSLKALVYLHAKNIIHRDIKAGNILLTRDGDVKLTDFGISKVVEQQVINDEEDNEYHMPAGSPLWMSPELLKGVAPSAKADIWALGITMIELAEAEPPLFNMKPLEVMQHIEASPPPKLSDESIWSPEFVDFVNKCLTLNPDERPSAMELIQHPFVARPDLTKELLLPIFDTIDDDDGESGGFKIFRRVSRAFQQFRRRSLQGSAMSKRVVHRKKIRDISRNYNSSFVQGTDVLRKTLNLRATMSLHRTMDLKRTMEMQFNKRTAPEAKELDADLLHICNETVFGRPLKYITELTGDQGVPRLIEVCTFYLMRYGLEEPGLFRINGDKNVLNELKDKIDNEVEVDLAPYDPHTITGLMKMFLRMLPEPLLTYERYPSFITLYKQENFMSVSKLAEDLPSPNKETFRFLLVFLSIAAKNEDKTQMSVRNLAMVFAPNMLKSKDESPEKMAADSNMCIGIIEYLMMEEMKRLEAVEGQVDEHGNLIDDESFDDDIPSPLPTEPEGSNFRETPGGDDNTTALVPHSPKSSKASMSNRRKRNNKSSINNNKSSNNNYSKSSINNNNKSSINNYSKSSINNNNKSSINNNNKSSINNNNKSSINNNSNNELSRMQEDEIIRKKERKNRKRKEKKKKANSVTPSNHRRRMSAPELPPEFKDYNSKSNQSSNQDNEVFSPRTERYQQMSRADRKQLWSQSVKDFKQVDRTKIKMPRRIRHAIIPRAKNIAIGTRMQVTNGRFAGLVGTVAYVGKVHFGPGPWIGLKLEEPNGNCDGSKRGRRYFRCDKNEGIFVKSAMLRPIIDENASFEVTENPQQNSSIRKRRSRSARGPRERQIVTTPKTKKSSQYRNSRWANMSAEEEAMLVDHDDDMSVVSESYDVDISNILPPSTTNVKPVSLFQSNSKRLEQIREARQKSDSIDKNDENDPLSLLYAAEDGDKDTLLKLLKRHPEWIETTDDLGDTCLHKAARGGNEKFCSLLLRCDPELLEARNDEGQSALMLACMAGHTDVIKLLIKKDADVNMIDNNGNFPLFSAAGWSPNPIITLEALFTSPEVDFDLRDGSGLTALEWCYQSDKPEIEALITRAMAFQDENRPYEPYSLYPSSEED